MEQRVTKIKLIEGDKLEFEKEYQKWAKQGYEIDASTISRLEYVGKIYTCAIMILPFAVEDKLKNQKELDLDGMPTQEN